MLKSEQKKQAAAGAKIAAKASNSIDADDFIPQSEHLDARTLLTKNGEVMQTIRISMNRDGLNYEQHDNLIASLRETIRSALVNSIHTDNVAIWIHTLRKRRKVFFENEFSNPFAAYINNHWRKKHGWDHQYYNEIYISLIYDGQDGKLFDTKLAQNTVWPSRNRQFRQTYLEAITAELSLMMDNVIDAISEHYQVHLLSVVERLPDDSANVLPRAPIFYSEPMEFLSYLLNLREDAVPLLEASIHRSLQSSSLMIGFNALETKSSDGKKRFAALLSLKNYREVPTHTVDMLLQSPMEMIISQAFHFIPHQEALKNYRQQRELFEISGDSYSMQASGLTEIFDGNRKQPTDFGHQQTCFMVIVDELKLLDNSVARLQEAFGDIGLVCVREDIRLEEIFWSTLPGNFEFLRRKDPINTPRIAGFARLNRFASGRSDNNLWSQPIALLPTIVNSPYFFNFHVQDNGHTLWLDFNSFQDKKGVETLSFLLTQTQKLATRLYYFDQGQSAKLWFGKMGAAYATVHPGQKTKSISINPFLLPIEPRNMGFLVAWCCELVQADDAEKKTLADALESFFAAPMTRSLSAFIAHLVMIDIELSKRFAPWDKKGEFTHLFAAAEDESLWQTPWTGFDLTAVLTSPQNTIPIFSYLLHRVIMGLNGDPAIIVFRNMLPALSHPFLASRLESLLEMLKENNVMVIFAEQFSSHLLEQPTMQTIVKNCVSIIIVPDDIKQDYASMAPQIATSGDENLLWHMNRAQGEFLLKQKKETVALRVNLDGMEDIAAIFGNDIKTLIAAGGPFANIPEEKE